MAGSVTAPTSDAVRKEHVFVSDDARLNMLSEESDDCGEAVDDIPTLTKKKLTSREKYLRKLYKKRYGKFVDVYVLSDAGQRG